MQQYISFQSIGKQKRIFRNNINQAIISYFEVKEHKIFFGKVEYLKNQVMGYARKSNVLRIEANQRKHIV